MFSEVPRANILRSSLLESSQVVDIPHSFLAKLPNESTIKKSVEVDVVVVGGGNDEELTELLAFDYLDAVDGGLVRHDEPFYFDVV